MSKVKICGLSRPCDIDAVNGEGPDYIGFVFAKSRRRVDRKTAAMLREKLDPRIKAVGVFVNETVEAVAELVQSGIIDLAQLHGDEDGAYIKRLKERCGCAVIKAVGVGGALPPLPAEPDYLLFDTLSVPRGGVGKAFDWDVLSGYQGLPYFLAGGLSIDNVSEALKRLSPYCVDVSSGVETDGFKDPLKIKRLIETIRNG